MKRLNHLAILLLPLAAAALAPAPACAQVDTSSQIVVKQNHPKPVWLTGNVIHADGHSIVVSDLNNPRAIHTFTYAGKSLTQMTKVLNEGGYQTGDKVKILYQPGDTVALDIRGKPSKSP
ncbi:MAG TPA: hypothetical protein VMU43_05885 [Candidatus Acidoferrum sp.]|nr:hypothetical protein [Candidatus Acidoferrum sp.]